MADSHTVSLSSLSRATASHSDNSWLFFDIDILPLSLIFIAAAAISCFHFIFAIIYANISPLRRHFRAIAATIFDDLRRFSPRRFIFIDMPHYH
jgi:hypothetical protein